MCYMGAHWRNLANTIESFLCGGDAPYVKNYFDHLLFLLLLLRKCSDYSDTVANTSGALYVVDQIEQLLRCVCVSVSLSVSGKQLSNDMALDLDIWHAASSLHYLRQIRSSNISHFTLVLPSSESL